MPSLILAGFAAAWLAAGLLDLHGGFPIVHLAFAMTIIVLTCAAPLWPGSAVSKRQHQHERSSRMLTAVTIIQAVSIATAAAILLLLQLPEYIFVSAAMIAGLHLLPAARQTSRVDRTTAILLLGWSLGCLVLVARVHIAAVSEIGAGCVLLIGIFLRIFDPFTANAEPGKRPES